MRVRQNSRSEGRRGEENQKGKESKFSVPYKLADKDKKNKTRENKKKGRIPPSYANSFKVEKIE